MDAAFEKRLITKIEPMYKNGREGDWDHILRTVDLCRYLMAHENGDPGIVLPAAYLHDLGWAIVDYADFNAATPGVKTKTTSFLKHMEQGAILAGKILKELSYGEAETREIQSIIKIHDLPEKIFKMNKINATLVVEADRLDRYGKTGIRRFKTMFGKEKISGPYWEEAKKMRREGLGTWFITPTARLLAKKLATEMGLFD
ncbi:MAG: HD domain-containing protein [Desulfotignum sp.]|nr:HD domain-containing protein [Desulfotignum sp.]MCF8137714.1 HD domain-containing protein [Desulfotignum sp.]